MQVSALGHSHGPSSMGGRPTGDTTSAPPSNPDQVLAHGARPNPVTGQSRLGAALVEPAVATLTEVARRTGNGHGAVVTNEFVATENGYTRTHSVTLPNGKALTHEKTVDGDTLTITRSRVDAEGNGTERELSVVKDAAGQAATVTRSFSAIVPPAPVEIPTDEEATPDPALDELPLEETVA